MHGQAHLPLARLVGIVATGFLVVALVITGPAAGEPNTTGAATGLRLANTQLAAKARSAELGLYSLDSQLAAARARLSSVHAQLVVLRNERAVLRQEVEVARAGRLISERQLASRLRQLYDQSHVSAIEVVFGAKSIGDAMTQLDNIHRVASLNDDVLTQLHTAQTRFRTVSHRLAARTAAVSAALRNATATEQALSRARANRASYIASLAARQHLNDAQIVRLELRARAAQARSQQLTKAAPVLAIAAPVATVAPPATSAAFTGNGKLTAVISGYALPGTTATGIRVGWGVAAVDPRVIPLGTHIWVPGYGEAVAADVGSAIIGTRIDIWFPTLAQAQAWGLKTVTIEIR